MGKYTKRVEEFIRLILDTKFISFPSKGGTIFKDRNFRLDI